MKVLDQFTDCILLALENSSGGEDNFADHLENIFRGPRGTGLAEVPPKKPAQSVGTKRIGSHVTWK